ncbi:MAG TPA: arsenite methyltransferase [Blastocatellia bacterium]|nr:arsenite methyltransferase [Blastocatellia bacterium]
MSENIQDAVKSRYGSIASSSLSSEQSGIRAVAQAFGYSPEELLSIPAEANMGLSCGNPIAFASLREGETVVDLGSGGGLDVFLASAKVGPLGKAIGIDMTPEMIARAKKNAEKGIDGKPYGNVEFHLAKIESLPLPDASVDCVISNCVINLVPDKSASFKEIARILKPGGRLAISDIALKRELPSEVAKDVLAYVGCIAGAISIDDYKRGLGDAGFSKVEIVETGSDLNAYKSAECAAPQADTSQSGALPIATSSCCGGGSSSDAGMAGIADLLSRYNVNEFAASVRVWAVK